MLKQMKQKQLLSGITGKDNVESFELTWESYNNTYSTAFPNYTLRPIIKIKFKDNYTLVMDDIKINVSETECIKILTYFIFDDKTAMIFDTFDEDDPTKIDIYDSQATSFLKLERPRIDLNISEMVKKSIYQTYLYLES